MKTKTEKLRTTDKDEKRFYQFAKALIAVPRKELDKELNKHDHKKETKRKTS